MTSNRSYPVWAIGACVGLVIALVFDWALRTNSYNVWGAVLVIPVVVAVNIALVWRLSRGLHDDPWLARILELALIARGVGTLGRYLVAYVAYGGAADAQRYNLYAAANYPAWRAGHVTWSDGGKQGTQVMELITTGVYTVIGPSPLAAFMVFSSFAFWGTYLLYRAFVIAVPGGDHKRYALLLFFLPSILFWPSSIGKESWLMLFVGVTAYGAARFFTRSGWGLPLLGLGALGTALIRPHVSVLLFAALLAAQSFRPARTARLGIIGKAFGLLVLAAGAALLATQSAQFLGIDDLSLQAIGDTVDYAGELASQGGSAFKTVPLSSPLGIPMAFITVLFRPFPFETRNPAMLLQSVEGLVICYLLVKERARLRRPLRRLRANPYLAFCAVYVCSFVIAFSGFGNFGILARQRVLMIPLLLVFLALPTPERTRATSTSRHHARL